MWLSKDASTSRTSSKGVATTVWISPFIPPTHGRAGTGGALVGRNHLAGGEHHAVMHAHGCAATLPLLRTPGSEGVDAGCVFRRELRLHRPCLHIYRCTQINIDYDTIPQGCGLLAVTEALKCG